MFKQGLPAIMITSLLVLSGAQGAAVAQQPVIMLTPVDSANPDIDGIWTTANEWSRASLSMTNYTDGTHLAIRGMHNADFILVMLEMPNDYVVDGHAGVCFDLQNDGGPYMGTEDYCFVMGSALREYHGDGRTTLMQQVPLEQFVTAQRGLSDSKSPLYSSKSHVTYEFKIPLDYLGSDNTHYGFYVSYDTRGQDTNYTYYYSWPDYKSAEYLRVASPRSWGIASLSAEIVPEFPVPVIGALAAIVGAVAVLSRTKLIKF